MLSTLFALCFLFLVSGAPWESAAMPASQARDLILVVVYDNNPHDKALETRWGFSCFIEGLDKTILLDVGGDGSVLLRNLQKLRINPRSVDVVVLSHVHSDHIGGLSAFLHVNPEVTVFVPRSFPERVRREVKKIGAQLVEVQSATRICKDVHSTGELGTYIMEQSLVINTLKGLVVVTGCAHPGIVNIVTKAKEMMKAEVYLALGGFHLSSMRAPDVRRIVGALRDQGVKRAAPCHCSGDLARKIFAKVYGENFISAGVGRQIRIENAF